MSSSFVGLQKNDSCISINSNPNESDASTIIPELELEKLYKALEEKDKDAFNPRLLQSFLTATLNTFLKHPKCMWRKHGDLVSELLFLHTMTETDTIRQFKEVSALQLSNCMECVDAYHFHRERIFSKFGALYEEETVSQFRKILYEWDVKRILSVFATKGSMASNAEAEMVVAGILEAFKYPSILLHEQIKESLPSILEQVITAKRMTKLKCLLPGLVYFSVTDSSVIQGWVIPTLHAILCGPKVRISEEEWQKVKPIFVSLLSLVLENSPALDKGMTGDKNRFLSGLTASLAILPKERVVELFEQPNISLKKLVSRLFEELNPVNGDGHMEALRCLCVLQTLLDKTVTNEYLCIFKSASSSMSKESEDDSLLDMLKFIFQGGNLLKNAAKDRDTSESSGRLERFPHFVKSERRDIPFVFLNYLINEWSITKRPRKVELLTFLISECLEKIQSSDMFCRRIKYLASLIGLKVFQVALPQFCNTEDNSIWQILTPNVTSLILDSSRQKGVLSEVVIPDILCTLYEVDSKTIVAYAEKLLTDSSSMVKPLKLYAQTLWIPFCKANLSFVTPRIYGKLASSYANIIFVDVAFIQNILSFCSFDDSSPFLENIKVIRESVLCLREFLRNVYRFLPQNAFTPDYLNSEEWKNNIPSVLHLLCSPIEQEAAALETFLNRVYRKESFADVFVTITDSHPSLVFSTVIRITEQISKWLKMGLPLHFTVRRTAPLIALALNCVFKISNNRCVGTVLDDCPEKIELLSRFWVGFWNLSMLFAEKAGLFMQVPEIIKVDLNCSVIFRSLQSVIISIFDLNLLEIFVDNNEKVRMEEDMDRWMPILCYLISCDLKTKFINSVHERSLALLFWIFKIFSISNIKLREKSFEALNNLIVDPSNANKVKGDEKKRLEAWLNALTDPVMKAALKEKALLASENEPQDILNLESSLLLKRKREPTDLEASSSILVPKKAQVAPAPLKAMDVYEEGETDESCDEDNQGNSNNVKTKDCDDNEEEDDDDDDDDDELLFKELVAQNQQLNETLKMELDSIDDCMIFDLNFNEDSGRRDVLTEDLDGFYHHVLKSMHEILVNPKSAFQQDESLEIMPSRFSSYEQYKNQMIPLLMVETRAQLLKCREEIILNKGVPLTIRPGGHGTSKVLKLEDSIYVVSFDLKGLSRAEWNESRLSVNDLVLFQDVSRSGNQGIKETDSTVIIGIIKSILNGDDGLQLLVHLHYKQKQKQQQQQQEYEEDVNVKFGTETTTFLATRLLSLNTAVREYGALVDAKSKCNPEILGQILNPTWIPYVAETKILKGVVTQFRLNYRVNETQAVAILSCLYNPNPFSLIQGPPGTGKTRVILTLLSSLIFPQFFFPAPIEPPKRILVCAPSNAAVDELVKRVSEGLYGENSEKINIAMVRLGKSSDVVSDLGKAYLLDNLVEKRLESQYPMQFYEYAKAKNRLMALEAEIEKLQGQRDQTLCRKNLVDEINRIKRSQSNNISFLESSKRNLRLTLLNEAQVVLCTLSGSGQDILFEVEGGFEHVIMDECCQAVEPSCIIPLRYGCKRCTMVGDPNQLPATLFSKKAVKCSYDQSLFERMISCDPNFSIMLNVQYRMNPEISLFPSEYFYDMKLLDGPNIRSGNKKIWHNDERTLPYLFYDVKGDATTVGSGKSLKNEKEAEFVVKLISYLCEKNPTINFAKRISVLTPYKQQQKEISNHLEKAFGANVVAEGIIDVRTIDAFQGQENDIVILSCVRSKPKLVGGRNTSNFFSDIRRMNVSLTRAKFSLFIVGNAESIITEQPWSKLVENVKKRNLYRSVNDFWNEQKITTPAFIDGHHHNHNHYSSSGGSGGGNGAVSLSSFFTANQ